MSKNSRLRCFFSLLPVALIFVTAPAALLTSNQRKFPREACPLEKNMPNACFLCVEYRWIQACLHELGSCICRPTASSIIVALYVQ
jgi:hypothetical protein